VALALFTQEHLQAKKYRCSSWKLDLEVPAGSFLPPYPHSFLSHE
jgi:hypothetical protein